MASESSKFFLPQDCFGYLGFLQIPCEFGDFFFSTSAKNAIGILKRTALNLRLLLVV